MKDPTCDVLVIGAGPGGYVCAVRCGQAGLDTMIVERDRPGGTCLNVGCIPSKAIICAADAFHALSQAASGRSAAGLSCSAPRIDFGRTRDWKDGIVERLNGGVSGLLKKAGVRSVAGRATFLDGRTVLVSGDGGMCGSGPGIS